MMRIVFTCDHCGCEIDTEFEQEMRNIEISRASYNCHLCVDCLTKLRRVVLRFTTKAQAPEQEADNG